MLPAMLLIATGLLIVGLTLRPRHAAELPRHLAPRRRRPF